MMGIISFFVLLSSGVSSAYASEDIMTLTKNAVYNVLEVNRPVASMVIDAHDGRILWQEGIDLPRDPASISKLMTLLLVFDAIKEGKFALDTQITATPKDEAIGKIYEISNNKMTSGVNYSVRELITLTLVPSSNVATIMLSRLVESNEGLFVTKMNEKAKFLGMNQTHFYNASGASAVAFQGYYQPQGYEWQKNNQTSARDLAIMTFHFLKDHPEITEFTKEPVVTTKKGTAHEETFEAYNHSLPGKKYALTGVDGLKTGSSPLAAFNIVATAKENNTRIIGIIMGVGDWVDQDGEYYRHPFLNAIFKYAFERYEYKKLLSAGENEINGQKIVLADDFYATVDKNQEPKYQLQNGTLQVESNQPLVNENLPVAQVNYHNLAMEKQNNQSKEKLSVQKQIILPLLFLGAGISSISCHFLIMRFKKKQRVKTRRRHRKSSLPSFLFIFIGFLFIIVSVLLYFV
jgi:D-alanyl-D-alanine carboxypeptidase